MTTNCKNLFYSPEILPPQHQFDREESSHIVRVLRLNQGDPIHLTNGKGNLFHCEITPLICAHSERATVKSERLNKILIAALKQSLKSWLPMLHEPQPFRELISQEFSGQKFIAYCETGSEALLQKAYKPGEPVLILIGPEGDFSPEEVEQAKQAGFIPVSLGKSRLRTETAGGVACTTFQLVNQS
ncbi:MAG: 16S rRNA (uracil(1498)-N(3))-methyltransferase [Bacteroidales bacterium]|nr:16S rRNA (uracil(1498)-N(3))-methyltransferase [Bacteroidales bacterium]